MFHFLQETFLHFSVDRNDAVTQESSDSESGPSFWRQTRGPVHGPLNITLPALDRLTGHVELSSHEPVDPPAAQLAVSDPLERFHPAESVGGGSPEPIRIRHRELVQVPVRQTGQLGVPCACRHGGQTPLWSRSGSCLTRSAGPAETEEAPEASGAPATESSHVSSTSTTD